MKINSDKQIGMEEVKLSLFADEILIYADNTKESTKQLISEYSKVAGYKVNI